MSEVWPTDLPTRFNLDGYRQGVGQNVIRSTMDTGPAKTRRRSTAATQPLSGVMEMTVDQVSSLKTFFSTTTLDGVIPFTFPDPLGGSDLLVRFTDPPEWSSRLPDFYQVNIGLEILP